MFSPGQMFAGYRIVRVLGAGGMGEVYLAQHPRLPREDALKILPRELTDDPTYRARFIREADLASGLDHPGIVSVYDRGDEQGQLWITMKFVPGSDANVLVNEHGPFAAADAVEVITAVADALDYAHGKGLLHRDVKPANILIDSTQATNRKVYLTDFGIARAIGSDTALTAANLTVGSIQYTSPEQLRAGDLNGRADQYSLACTAFRLLTGQAPFPGRKPTDIINAHLTGPIPRARAIRPELPTTVDAVLARAMGKQAVNRYPTCMDFARDLRAALATGPSSPAGGYQPTMINPGPLGVSQPPKPQADPQVQYPQQPQYAQPQQPQNAQPQYGQQQYAQPQNVQPQYARPHYAPQQQFGSVPPSYGGPPAGGVAGGGATGGGGGSKTALIVIGVLVVALLLAGGVFWLVNRDSGDSSSTAASSSSSSSSSEVSTPAPSSTATDPAVVAGVPTRCVNGRTTSNVVPTRLQSGRIEIPAADMPTDWESDRSSRFPFVTDADGVLKQVTSGWYAQIAVGTFPTDFTTDTEAIARKVLECFAAGPAYSSVRTTGPAGTVVQPRKIENSTTVVSLLTSGVPVTGAPAGVSGDDVIIAVVNSSPMTFAIGVSPTGDSATQAVVRKAVEGLLVRTR